MSTTSRILVGFLLFLAVALYALESRLLKRVERQYREAAEEPMVDTAQLFAAWLEEHVDASGQLDLSTLRRAFSSAGERKFSAQIYNLTKTSINTNLYVTDHHGVVLFDSDHGAAEGHNYLGRRDVALTLSGEYGARSTYSDPKDRDSSVMFVAAPIRHRGEIIGSVSISKPQSSFFSFRDETQTWIRNLGWTFFFAVTGGAYLVVTLFSRPIRRLTSYARGIARGERRAPPRLDSPEVATLGRAFEDMRDALEDRKYVESYVQTLTHEMKSPVAAIRGAAELLREEMPCERRDQFVANIQAESRRLQNIIDRLLSLSAIESRKTLEQPEPVSLVELAEAIRAQMKPAMEAHGIGLELVIEKRPVVRGEPFLLEIAVTNLLQNAINFSPIGATISMRIGANEQEAQLTIEDEGSGIPEYALARIFERFYSLQQPGTGRKSSGLGLCFVREAVELHGGTVTIVNRVGLPGVRAILSFPLARLLE